MRRFLTRSRLAAVNRKVVLGVSAIESASEMPTLRENRSVACVLRGAPSRTPRPGSQAIKIKAQRWCGVFLLWPPRGSPPRQKKRGVWLGGGGPPPHPPRGQKKKP